MINPPIATFDSTEDPYAWLRDVNWPKIKTQEILDYVKAENDYFEAVTKSHKQLENQIYEELESRIKEEDESYPVKEDKYYYYTRMEKGKDYSVICRKFEKEEILLDCNTLAEGKSSFALGSVEVSNDHSKLAYAYDADGSERYTVKVRDLSAKEDLSDVILDTIGEIIWNKQGSGFYYCKLNENWRPNQVYFHLLGREQSEDKLIYQEADHGFYLHIGKTSSKDYLLIETGNGSYNEILYHNLDEEAEASKIMISRRADHLYSLDHINGKFYMLTNDMGKNFRLITLEGEKQRELIPHNDDHYLVDIDCYNQYLVVTKRILGINIIEYYDLENYALIDQIKFPEEIYQANVRFTNKEDSFLRINYSSLTTPNSVLEYEFATKKLFTRKTDEVKNYHQALYETKRLWADSTDGVKVPISIVYRKGKLGKKNPLLLYGYGSYGMGVPINFRSNIISLLDRGFVYAIAHIRGGDELGFNWYHQAKFLNKKRTFEDFIASAEFLIKAGYTSSEKLAIMGGSAGGMLMGVVVNQRPDLFKAVVALVPFVDVINTMLDESLPLTPVEFEEWGNPKNKDYYDYMKSYSPYDNVKNMDYPAMLVTAGLTDPRVGYWEAAKWVAKLRKFKTDNNILVLKTDMDAGHSGQSGRFKRLEEVAMIYSFILSIIK
ncbi:MAG: S9 family peptidase [Pseudomonadota bacterium]